MRKFGNKRAVTGMLLAGGTLVGTFAGLGVTTATAATAPISISSFNTTFSSMAALKPIAAKGTGLIGVILPDTTSSARYVEFDQPYLQEALTKAGIPANDISIQNAQGSDATALTDATADITNGAKVLAIDPEDPAGGVAIESYAKAHGVAVIDYDRLTLGGSRSYYVSFNNVQVGTLMGKGLVSCITTEKVAKPQVIVMRGDPTDNNATLFAQGYDAVLAPYFKSGKYVEAATPAGTWTPATALSEFQQAFTAHAGINAALIPNDENGAPIISFLQTKGVKPYTFPTTGQDATSVGLQNIISGYQCGTVYKPIYEEAQAAAALAVYLRAGITPPKTLVNGTAEDTTSNVAVPSVLLKPEWVTAKTMESTIVKDKFVPASVICKGFAADCAKYGIK
jgi:D-xylose transport system substrate-binding protein